MPSKVMVARLKGPHVARSRLGIVRLEAKSLLFVTPEKAKGLENRIEIVDDPPVEFSSPTSAEAAIAARLLPRDFEGFTPSGKGGFTKADVLAVVEALDPGSVVVDGPEEPEEPDEGEDEDEDDEDDPEGGEGGEDGDEDEDDDED